MTIEELIALVDLRFLSGNAVPVERAPIKTTEWQQIKAAIAAQKEPK